MTNVRIVSLGEVLKDSKSISDNSNPNKRITVRLNVKGVEKRDFTESVEGGTKYYVRSAGQFIYGKQNLFKGAFGIVPEELDGYESSSDIPSFDIDESCRSKWLLLFLRQNNFYKSLESIARGSGSKRIHPEDLFKIEMPLPSLEDQDIKIQKCIQLEEKILNLANHLEKSKSYVNMLRQSILQEAIQGKLVLQDPNDEPASVLLERIRAEKEQLIKDKKIKKEKLLAPITDDEKPFKLSNGWEWVRLGEIIKDKPRNGYSPKSVDNLTDVKSLTLTATTSGKFRPECYKYIDESISNESYLWLETGDILIQRSNSLEYVGTSCIFTGEPKTFIFPDLMMKIQVFKKVEVQYLQSVLSSRNTREYFQKCASGTSSSMPKINQSIVMNTLIPVPPFNEQKRIVEKVNQLMALCDELEKAVMQSKQDSEMLMQAVLNEGFKTA